MSSPSKSPVKSSASQLFDLLWYHEPCECLTELRKLNPQILRSLKLSHLCSVTANQGHNLRTNRTEIQRTQLENATLNAPYPESGFQKNSFKAKSRKSRKISRARVNLSSHKIHNVTQCPEVLYIIDLESFSALITHHDY